MATPTKAELWNQIAHACRLINEHWKWCVSNTRNFLADSDSFQQVFEGNHISATQNALSLFRSQLGALLLNGRSFLEPLLMELARTGYSSVEDSIDTMLVDIFDGMVLATETILNRAWTFGGSGIATADGGNNGTGKVYRLTKDADQYNIESGSLTGGIIKFLCQSDRHHGLEEGNEEFAVFGSGRRPFDQLDLGTCTEGKGIISATRAHDGILVNPSFDTFTSATGSSPYSLTDANSLPGWTFTTSYTNAVIDTTTYYRREPGNTIGHSLKFTASDTITQRLVDAAANIDPSAPVMFLVRYNRQVGAFTGDLTIACGALTATIALAAQTGWNDLICGYNTDHNAWYKNFMSDVSGQGTLVTVTVARTGGSLYVDEIVLIQPKMFDGRWYLVTAGGTDYLRDDSFTFTDSVANTGIMQYWISRLFGRYMPHAAAGETYSDTPS